MMPFRKQHAINVTWPFAVGFNGRGVGWLDDVFIWMNFQKISFFQDVFVKRLWELMSFVIGMFQGSFNYPFGEDQTMQINIVNWREFPLNSALF